MLTLGVDEAGRGALIGPLVVAGVVIDESKHKELKELGVKDSKMLSPRQRESLYPRIIKFVKNYSIKVISNKEVDNRRDIGLNLNELEALKIAQIISELKPDKAIIDSPHPVVEKFAPVIRRFLSGSKDIKLVLEHKADVNHPEVSAGSILAKVTRDRLIEELKERLGVDFGSGYPSDHKTKEAVRKYRSKLLPYIRQTWATNIGLGQKKLMET